MMVSDKGLTIDELLKYINEYSYEPEYLKSLGVLTDEHKAEYKNLLDQFKYTHSHSNLNGRDSTNDHNIRGKALEELTRCLFESTGGYYNIYNNIRNGCNEIDLFVEYSWKANAIKKFLPTNYSRILCECKNYNNSVSVTYVGKFHSLMCTTNNRMGIMFSYHGLSGQSWSGSVGLTKKIFMLRENLDDKIFILDFNYRDFKSIYDGKSLFKILDDKCTGLKLGVDDITKYFVPHPNESKYSIQ